MVDDRQPKPFDRETLQLAFARLGEMALAEGKIVEISVYGGSAVVLTLPSRPATRDVDAVFDADRTFVRRAAALIASELGWKPDWINDGVKGFLSHADSAAQSKSLFRTFPSSDRPGLRVFIASPAYLFAMKCLAMRTGGAQAEDDVADIRRLAETLGIRKTEEALDIVSRYYPLEALPPKTQFGLEEIFGRSEP